jgi:hypothetical protein
MKRKKILKAGDSIRINSEPNNWASNLEQNTPINAGLKYPVTGVVKEAKRITAPCTGDYTALKIKIGRKMYGFSQEDTDFDIMPDKK